METFQIRCRTAISLGIKNLKDALYHQKQLSAEGRGDPMTQVFSAIEGLRQTTTDRRETAELRLGQHIKLMRGRTKALTEHLRNVHFRRTNQYRTDINESYRNVLQYVDTIQSNQMSAVGGRVRRKKPPKAEADDELGELPKLPTPAKAVDRGGGPGSRPSTSRKSARAI